MIRRPPISTRTDTLFPYTTLVRSAALRLGQALGGQCALDDLLVEPPVGEVRDPHAADQHREPGQFLIMRIIGGQAHLEMSGYAAGEVDEPAANASRAAALPGREPGDGAPPATEQRDRAENGQRKMGEA